MRAQEFHSVGRRFAVGLLLLAAVPAAAQDSRAPAGGMAVATLEGNARVDGPLRFRLEIRNSGKDALPFGPTNRLFGLLTLKPGHGKPYLSDKVTLVPSAPWPMALKPGASLSFEAVDVGSVTGRLAGGWQELRTGNFPASGRLNALLQPGTVRARWCVSVPRPGEAPPIHFLSEWQELDVPAVRSADTSLPGTPAAVSNLLQRFNRDAWSAQQAHDEAMKRGAAIVPDLAAAAAERTRPDFARMWLATAIADIPGAPSAAALVSLLDDAAGEVRCVVAYHGPKQKSAALDEAIFATARKSNSAHFTAYALLGFLAFRGEAPEALVKAGLESEEPQARAAAASVLATMASELNKSRLRALLQDPNERVRAVARKVLDAMPADKPVAPQK